MALPLYQVDAFTRRPYAGNPAAVMPLERWLEAPLMQAIAAENNLSETAFLVPATQTGADFEIRWFTPSAEADLCGHATLASAFVMFTRRGWDRDEIRFSSASGGLVARRGDDGMITLDFPAREGAPMPVPDGLEAAIGSRVMEFRKAVMNMAVLDSEVAVRAVEPDLGYIRDLDGDGLIITGPGDHCDCASRYFAPHCGIDEDPVTGAAHCTVVPYWAARLGSTSLHARQVSARGGDLWCRLEGDRVLISGHAVLYMTGEILEQ
ncbi:MAG: PhzF family phenazine biosynthesis protein [Candidatus Puniceispirillaceae bacterium]